MERESAQGCVRHQSATLASGRPRSVHGTTSELPLAEEPRVRIHLSPAQSRANTVSGDMKKVTASRTQRRTHSRRLGRIPAKSHAYHLRKRVSARRRLPLWKCARTGFSRYLPVRQGSAEVLWVYWWCSTTRPRTFPPLFRSLSAALASAAGLVSSGIGGTLPAWTRASSSRRSSSVPT